MILRSILASFAMLALAAAPAIAAPKKAAATARDWSKTVTLGTNGAYVLGNPAAKTRLVEYLSYTCPHCAAFSSEGWPSLRAGWVKRGMVSIELRNFIRDPFDLSAAMLARCGGAARFLGNHEALFFNHEPWIKQAETYQAPKPAPDQTGQIADIAEKTGLIAFLAKQDLTPAAQRLCLADKQALATILALTASAWDNKGFNGTPFFILNGKELDEVHDWKSLQPLLPPLPRSGK